MPGQHITADQVDQIIHLATPHFVQAVRAELDSVRDDVIKSIKENRAQLEQKITDVDAKANARIDAIEKRVGNTEKQTVRARGYWSGISAMGAWLTVAVDFAFRLIWKR